MARPKKDPAAAAAKAAAAKAEREAKAAEKAAAKEAERTAKAQADAKAKAEKGAVVITDRFDEPCQRQVFDVSYAVNGGLAQDKGFLTQEAAETHAAGIRDAYGL